MFSNVIETERYVVEIFAMPPPNSLATWIFQTICWLQRCTVSPRGHESCNNYLRQNLPLKYSNLKLNIKPPHFYKLRDYILLHDIVSYPVDEHKCLSLKYRDTFGLI